MPTPAAIELDLDSSFLTHSTNASGSGFLKSWKEAGKIVVWLHPAAKIWSMWNHTWYRYAKDHDEETGKDYNIIIPQRMLCLENEKTLKKQTWYEDDGRRTVPPEICPLDLCSLWMRQQIDAGKLEWSTPVFKFESESPIPEDNNDIVLYAGGFTGLFMKREKSRAELAQLSKCGVKESEAYLQNGNARMQYVFTVASAEDLDAGWLVAMEAPTLGNKLKKEINAEISRCDGDRVKGSPKTNPYPFEWTYDKNKEFSERYEVVAKSRTSPSPAVAKLLEEEAPSLDHLTQPPKLGALLKSMKAAAQIKMPLDQFFEAAAEVFGMQDDDSGEVEDEEERPYEVKGGSKAKVEEEADEEEPDEELPSEDNDIPDDDLEPSTCDVCKKVIGDDDMTCSHCGAVYDSDKEGNVVLKSRACGNTSCSETAVPIGKDGSGTCESCGAVHTQDSEGDWEVEIPKPVAKKEATPARRRGAKPQATPEKHSDARESRRSKAREVTGK